MSETLLAAAKNYPVAETFMHLLAERVGLPVNLSGMAGEGGGERNCPQAIAVESRSLICRFPPASLLPEFRETHGQESENFFHRAGACLLVVGY